MSISNTGLYFYRDYYNINSGFNPLSLSDEASKKRQEAYFKTKNATLLDFYPSEAQAQIVKAALPKVQSLEMRIAAPGMLLGTGYTHETGQLGEYKLGFFFDHTSGLPLVTGSSVKGKLRSAFPQFTRGKHGRSQWDLPSKMTDVQRAKAFYIHHLLWGDAARDFEKEILTEAEMTNIKMLTNVHRLELGIFEGIDIQATNEKMKAANNKELVYLNSYCRDTFFDAPIVYQKNTPIFQNDTITPHTKGQFKNPIPLSFLMLKAGTILQFSWRLHDLYLDDANIVSNDAKTVSIDAKKNLFAELIHLYGMGAKTSVNYGKLEFTAEEKKKREEQQIQQAKEEASIPKSTEFQNVTFKSANRKALTVTFDVPNSTYTYGTSVAMTEKEINFYRNNPKKKYTLIRTIINDVETWEIKP